MVAHARNLSIRAAEARGAKGQGHLCYLLSMSKSSRSSLASYCASWASLKNNFKNLSKGGKESSTLGTWPRIWCFSESRALCYILECLRIHGLEVREDAHRQKDDCFIESQENSDNPWPAWYGPGPCLRNFPCTELSEPKRGHVWLGIFIVTEIRKLSLSDTEELTSSQNQGHRFLQCPKLIQ